ncbi:hypothetical protein V5799_031489 [Amblyomma americanum]|uniref:Uncharacterized protein n=1 Tax=Amblyomma americanum TaxID=6943 RepID=A0AAQ4EK80_AMBAM
MAAVDSESGNASMLYPKNNPFPSSPLNATLHDFIYKTAVHCNGMNVSSIFYFDGWAYILDSEYSVHSACGTKQENAGIPLKKFVEETLCVKSINLEAWRVVSKPDEDYDTPVERDVASVIDRDSVASTPSQVSVATVSKSELLASDADVDMEDVDYAENEGRDEQEVVQDANIEELRVRRIEDIEDSDGDESIDGVIDEDEDEKPDIYTYDEDDDEYEHESPSDEFLDMFKVSPLEYDAGQVAVASIVTVIIGIAIGLAGYTCSRNITAESIKRGARHRAQKKALKKRR